MEEFTPIEDEEFSLCVSNFEGCSSGFHPALCVTTTDYCDWAVESRDTCVVINHILVWGNERLQRCASGPQLLPGVDAARGGVAGSPQSLLALTYH